MKIAYIHSNSATLRAPPSRIISGAALLIVDLVTADDGDSESATLQLEATPLPGGGATSIRGRF